MRVDETQTVLPPAVVHDPNAALSAAELMRPAQSALLKLLRKEPALGFTLGYLFLAAVGITYDVWFFHYFGVNVLNYADFSDFLLAAVREPLVMTFTVLSAAFILLLQEMNYRARVRFPAYDRMCRNPQAGMGQSNRFLSAYIQVLVLIVGYFGWIFTPIYARYRAGQIQAGRSAKVVVRLSSEPPATVAQESHIIGTTSQFVFLYDVPTRKVQIIPFDNVAEISFTRPLRKQEKPINPPVKPE
jgi:hypothetical protein